MGLGAMLSCPTTALQIRRNVLGHGCVVVGDLNAERAGRVIHGTVSAHVEDVLALQLVEMWQHLDRIQKL